MIKIGQIIKPFGVKGEVKVYSYTDFPLDRFNTKSKLFMDFNNEYIPLKVLSVKQADNILMIHFDGFNDVDQVEKYRQTDIYIDQTDIKPLNKGEYYIFEIKGLDVFDSDDKFLGKVKDVEMTGAHNNLRIEREDHSTFLVPNIPVFVKSIDIESKKIVVKLIEGLI